MLRVLLALFAVVATKSSLATSASPQMEHCFITNPHQNSSKIEFFILKPEGNGPFPVMFLLHGSQPPENTIGGKQLIEYHYPERFIKEEIAIVSISMPGFGNSTGPRDFSGPDSQKAIAAVIEHCSRLPYIDAKRMGIYGISKGAILASLVHVYYSGLTLQILEGGEYDLTTRRSLLPCYLKELRDNIIKEVGDSDGAYKARSALYNTQSIHAKTLLLHGEFDDRKGLASARALQTQLIQEKKECILKVYPNECHCLPPEKWETIIPYVRQQFFNVCGIGIKLTDWAVPAVQICKIHPDSPASKSEKLKIGDALLTISPNNDANEIDILHMPVNKIVKLILGEKGSTVRLRVQHFDLSYDDIVLERG